jgi:hypothetical protein
MYVFILSLFLSLFFFLKKKNKNKNKKYIDLLLIMPSLLLVHNLSKTCFWLLQNGLKVLIATCDTFRSGAVEQLKVHVRN